MSRIEIEDLPDDLGDADMSGFTPIKARALLQDAVLNAPDSAVTEALDAIANAMARYRDQSNARRTMLSVMEGVTSILETVGPIAMKVL